MTDFAWRVLVVALAGLAILEGVVLIGLLREVGAILLHVGPPRPGGRSGGPVDGAKVEIDGLVTPALLLFVSPTCAYCGPVVAALPALQRGYPSLETLAIVLGEDLEARRDYAEHLAIPYRLDLAALSREWDVPGTPFAVGVRSDGTVSASGVVNNLPQLEVVAEASSQSTVHADAGDSMDSPILGGIPISESVTSGHSDL